MTTTESPIVVGLFRDHALAEQAMHELQSNGFRDDQIRVIEQISRSSGLLEHLISTFSGQDTTPTTEEHIRADLMRKGISPDAADYYQHEVQAGHSMVMVEAGGQQEASAILHRYGAYDASAGAHDIPRDRVIPLRQEVLQVQKQWAETGEIIVRKEVITEEKTITVSVTREELVIERRIPGANQPTPQMATMGESVDEALADGGTLRIVLHEDQVRIEKYPVVKEEIFISKRQLQEIQHVAETVKHEEATLERVGDVIVHGNGAEELYREVPPVS